MDAKTLRVLDYELDSMAKNSKVFVRDKTNSNVFFLTTRNACKQDVKNQMKALETKEERIRPKEVTERPLNARQ
ncbi:unnamed protein product [Oppiella nova]|uniref:Uncharacterized protein n=1 Tax=Oppiella nova TaxID=334625 RepID=A0A7R9QAB0_9ACAR|nr:unnamed protein product [Oppiella nova]CAG2161756.1 unnamed protein product [Oppiella nova]